MRVYCKTCDLVLTNQLNQFEDKVNVFTRDAESFIPQGHYQVCDGTWGYDLFPSGLCENEMNCIVIAVSDALNIKDHKEAGRLNGCCGLAGLDGPNKMCLNGHEVGTEHSDCWHAWSLVFKKDAVILK